MDEEEKKFKEEALKLLAEADGLVFDSLHAAGWLETAEILIMKHRLMEIIKGKAI